MKVEVKASALKFKTKNKPTQPSVPLPAPEKVEEKAQTEGETKTLAEKSFELIKKKRMI